MSVTIQSPQTSGTATPPVDAVPLSERLQNRLPPPPPSPPRDELARPAPDAPAAPPALPDEHEQGQPLQPPALRSDTPLAVPGVAAPPPDGTARSAGVGEAAPRPDRRLLAGHAPRAAGVAPIAPTPQGHGSGDGAGRIVAVITPGARPVAGTDAPHADPATAARVTKPGIPERAGTPPAPAVADARSPIPADADAPVARSSPTPALVTVALAPASTPASPQSPSPSQLPPHTAASSGDAGSEPAPLPSSQAPAPIEQARPQDAAADTTSAPPAVAAVASPTQQGAAADGQTLADARRDDANLGTRQHVRAVRQAEALQTAMATRALEGSQVRVAFNSWGAGHAVTARLEGGRVHLQPSSARVGAALASSVAPGDGDLLIAVESSDSATDERRRQRDQGPA